MQVGLKLGSRFNWSTPRNFQILPNLSAIFDPLPLTERRQLVPTSGSRSTSLWDVPDPDALLAWLSENIGVDCTHEIYEVQEDFGLGLGEITRARAAERVASGTKDAYHAVASGTKDAYLEFDNKMRISERAGHAMEAVRESTVVQGTALALSRGASSVKQATQQVMAQPAVASASEAVGSGFKKLGQGLTSLTSRVASRVNSMSNNSSDLPADMRAGGSDVPAAHVLHHAPPPAYAAPAPVESPPARGSMDGAPARAAQPTPSSAFTLQDELVDLKP